jgi:hypothetical protein
VRRNGFLELGLLGLAMAACHGEVPLGGAEGDGGTVSSSAPGSPDATASTSSSGGTASSSGSSSGTSGSDSGASDGATSATGTAVVVASVANACLADIAVDATNVYAATQGVDFGSLFVAPLAGGPLTTLDSIGRQYLAINSTAVYTDAIGYSSTSPTDPGGVVVGCAKSGCGGNYSTLASRLGFVIGVAADEVNVYWATAGFPSDDGGVPNGSIGKAPIGGGPPTVLSNAINPSRIAVSGGTVFYLAATADAPPDHASVLSVSTDGGTPTVLVPGDPNGQSVIIALTVDGANVYYGTNDGAIFQIPRSGGTPKMLVAGSGLDDAGALRIDGGLASPLARQMAVDADRVYFRIAGQVNAVPIGGGTVTTLATSIRQDYCTDGLAVDGSYVYWSHHGDVMKVAK